MFQSQKHENYFSWIKMHVLPSDVSDVLVTSGVAHLPIQSDGTWSSGG